MHFGLCLQNFVRLDLQKRRLIDGRPIECDGRSIILPRQGQVVAMVIVHRQDGAFGRGCARSVGMATVGIRVQRTLRTYLLQHQSLAAHIEARVRRQNYPFGRYLKRAPELADLSARSPILLF